MNINKSDLIELIIRANGLRVVQYNERVNKMIIAKWDSSKIPDDIVHAIIKELDYYGLVDNTYTVKEGGYNLIQIKHCS